MVSGAVNVDLHGDEGNVINYICRDDTGFSGGDLLVLSGAARGVAPNAMVNGVEFFVGIAASEKFANDGETNIGVYTNVTADMKHDVGTSTAGQIMVLSGANTISHAPAATTALETANIVGVLLENAAASSTSTVRVTK